MKFLIMAYRDFPLFMAYNLYLINWDILQNNCTYKEEWNIDTDRDRDVFLSIFILPFYLSFFFIFPIMICVGLLQAIGVKFPEINFLLTENNIKVIIASALTGISIFCNKKIFVKKDKDEETI